MDAEQTSASPTSSPVRRLEPFDKTALVLQGGGALGAYQAGVYQALHEAGIEPDWVAGVSIGGINSAIIAGNPRERRLERLRDFWETITARHICGHTPDGDAPRKARNAWSSQVTMLLGQPGFFKPNVPNPWMSLRGSKTATSFYDNSPLRETLLRLIDFDLLNSGKVRYAAGAVNVQNGNFVYFDSAQTDIVPEHIMASGALPPALPMVRIGSDYYWDGGLVSNTPLQHMLDNAGSDSLMIFQVDLFSAHGELPRDMFDVLSRQKDIQYSSRTRMVTDYFRQRIKDQATIRDLLNKLPESELNREQLALKKRLADLPEINILHLIYQQMVYEGDAKDYEFSGTSMREHWQSGYRDTVRTLQHKEWLASTKKRGGVTVHDVHRADQDDA
jgi:NTE family protein